MKRMDSFKNKLKKVGLIFMMSMLLCTIISRTIYAYLLPKVSVGKVREGYLTNKVIVSGKIALDEAAVEANKQMIIANASGQVVACYKQEGEAVKAGEVIYEIEKLSTNKEQLTQAQTQLELELEAENLNRYKESYRLKKEHLLAKYEEQQEQLNNYERKPLWQTREEAIDKSRQEVEVNRELAKTNLIAPSELKSSEDALSQLEREYEAEKRSGRKSLESEIKTTLESIEEANQLLAETEGKILLNTQKQQWQVTEKEGSWQITSPIDGYIKSLQVTKGAYINEREQLATIVPSNLPYSLTAELEEEVADKLDIGTSLSFTMMKRLQKTQIVKKKMEYTSGKIQIIGEITPELYEQLGLEYMAYKSVTLEVVDNSEEYYLIVPNSAIKKSFGAVSIYVIEEREGLLGKKYVAREVEATLLEEGDYETAITGNVEQGSKVIKTGVALLSDGQEVTLEKGAAL